MPNIEYLHDKVKKLNETQRSFTCAMVNKFGQEIDGMGGPYCNETTLKYFAVEFTTDCLKAAMESPMVTDKGKELAKTVLKILGE